MGPVPVPLSREDGFYQPPPTDASVCARNRQGAGPAPAAAYISRAAWEAIAVFVYKGPLGTGS